MTEVYKKTIRIIFMNKLLLAAPCKHVVTTNKIDLHSIFPIMCNMKYMYLAAAIFIYTAINKKQSIYECTLAEVHVRYIFSFVLMSQLLDRWKLGVSWTPNNRRLSHFLSKL